MDVIQSKVRTDTANFRANSDAMRELVAELDHQLTKARRGGTNQAHARHRDQGKLPVRERIDQLIDPDSPFLELSALAAGGMYDGMAPAAGLVTGIGRVSGREVMILANDATVKGGTYFPITVKNLNLFVTPISNIYISLAINGNIGRMIQSQGIRK